MPIRKWFEKFLAPAPRRAPRRERARPMVEGLECRVVPAAFVELESNNTAGTANAVTVATGDVLTTAPTDWLTISGGVSSNADEDYFQFTLTARSGVFFDIDARETGLSATLDSVLTLYASDGTTVLDSNDDGYDFEGFATPTNSTSGATSPDSSLYVDLAPGTYFIRVTSFNAASSGNYQLRALADTTYSAAAPVLNSRPGAADTLYLDFDGHAGNALTDAWGTYSASPFDFSGNAGEFSPGERLAIRNIWLGVSEDYSPFNINISTVEPGSFANGVGFRQVVTTSDPSIVGQSSGILGVAFFNSYAGGSNDNVAFTWAANFSDFGGGASGQIMAQPVEMGNTSSHEFGHALGLDHYATSAGAQVVPNESIIPNGIMATPDQGLNREIFASGINESGNPQTDLDIIGSITGAGNNTFGLRPDDHGNSRPSSTPLTQQVPNLYSATGVITTTGDQDFFRFRAGGATTITIDVSDYFGNLNAVVRLFDAAGGQVAIDNPGGSFDATITMTLATGNYFISVASAGGTGEVGQYSVSIVTSVNLLPVVTPSAGAAAYINGGPPVLVDPGVILSDLDSTTLTAATVQITGGYVNGQDVLSVPNGLGVLSFFDAPTGTLTLFGSASIDDYQIALRAVVYSNTAANPTAGTRTLTFRATDGTTTFGGAPAYGLSATRALTVSAAPVLTVTGGTTPFVEGSAAVPIDASITVTDDDSANLVSATVQITIGYVSGQDVLGFVNANGITGAFNPATGTLTLTGASSVANYQAALRSVTYLNTSDSPSVGVRVATFTATDGTAPGPSVTKTIGVTPTNDGPVNTVPAGPLTTAEDAARPLTGLSIADVDAGTNPVTVTLSVANGTVTVGTAVVGGVTAAQVTGNGTATVTLTAPLAAINATLAANPMYAPLADYSGPDTLTVVTNDTGSSGGPALTDTDAVALTVTEVNDAPVATPDALPAVVVGSGVLSIPLATLTGNDATGPANESGQTLTVTTVGGAIGGTVAIVGANVEFTPTPGFTGAASFFYVIQDNGTTNGGADPKTATASVSFTISAAPVAPATPPAPPAPPAPAPAFYTGAAVAGTTLTLTGAGVAGGSQSLAVPSGTFAFFTDVNGDGRGDVVLIMPGLILVADGATGRFLFLFADTNGDGVRELTVF